MYELQFFATDDADWAQRVDLIDDATNLPLATSGVLFELEVSEHGARRLYKIFCTGVCRYLAPIALDRA
ncbi:MAG: hypothetical protein EOP24_29000 [Hyphomicrobiales bacterium]|jgi:uncharacterized protein (DUF39 family)|nr:MAG: hypothetical protein EOP24_29000 [Hyphomicrobiales bacterium]